MGLSLGESLRLFGRANPTYRDLASQGIAFVGAGGKTTAVFTLARESPVPALVTSTTHFGEWQTQLADRHIVANSPTDLQTIGDSNVTLVTGPFEADRRSLPCPPDVLEALRSEAMAGKRTLLIEADGARQKPLKAPGQDEPPIPIWVAMVVVVAGLSALGQPLSAEQVHRPEIFSELSGLEMGRQITSEALTKVLLDRLGGLKSMPNGARRCVLLNQADTAELQARASGLAPALLGEYEAVVVAALESQLVHAVHERCAGVILAAGEATRYGQPKQLLPWRGEPFIQAVAKTALDAGLSPVVVVTGANAEFCRVRPSRPCR